MVKSLTSSAFLAITLAAGPVTAMQAQVCDLISSDQINSAGTTGLRVSYLSNPFFRCSDGTQIKADSSVTYEATGLTTFIGDVVFREGKREMQSDEAQYYSSLGRLEAEGSIEVRVMDKNEVIVGDRLSLLQQNRDRSEDLMTVRGSQAYALISAGSVGVNAESNDSRINADLLHLIGDRILQAVGNVSVQRNSLELYSDSLELLQDGTRTKLFFNAEIRGAQDNSGISTNVKGDSVNILFSDNVLEEIQSVGEAEVEYDNGNGSVRGSEVDIFFRNDELKRITSTNDHASVREMIDNGLRAVATTEEFTITGDSIDLRLESGDLVSTEAFGNARGTSHSVSNEQGAVISPLLEEDWIEGDTVVVLFSESVSSQDLATEGNKRVIEQMTALGRARSFFRRRPVLEQSDSEEIPESEMELNYVRGDEVRILFSNGEVQQMEVVNAQGSFLQPTGRPDTISAGTNMTLRRNRKDD